MRHSIPAALGLSLASFGFLGCEAEAPTNSERVALERFGKSDWSEPENIGVPINSAGSDQNATLS